MSSNNGRALTQYDPFEDDFETRQQERDLNDARRAHELWSLEQARAGKSALSRTDDAIWIKPPYMTIGNTTDTKEAAPRG